MLFNSYIFVLFFLPLCILGYYGLNRLGHQRTALCFLIALSLWFYAYFNIKYILIIITSIVINYVLNRLITSKSGDIKKLLLVVGLVFNLGALGYFKYTDFFIKNINHLFHTDYALRNILLPLGISFFTFQQISYIIDSYRGEVPKYNIIEYACFVTFFPQLIAGPIVTHDEMIPQFLDESKKIFNCDNFNRGMYMFALGMAKKVLIADTLGNAVNYGYGNIASIDSTNGLIIVLCYTLQMYFDFSGYCDMAIGIGKMLGIDIPLNFDSPYKAITISEHWKRWHITLTRFFTKYLYIPLGGNRKGTLRTYLNILVVFTLSGFWHGADFSFVIWGSLHGLFIVINRIFKGVFDRIPKLINWIITFAFINFAFIFFRANSTSEAIEFFKVLLRGDFGPIDSNVIECFEWVEFKWLYGMFLESALIPMIITIVTALFIAVYPKNAFERMCEFKPMFRNGAITIILLVWCIVSFSGVSTFLYFNF